MHRKNCNTNETDQTQNKMQILYAITQNVYHFKDIDHIAIDLQCFFTLNVSSTAN